MRGAVILLFAPLILLLFAACDGPTQSPITPSPTLLDANVVTPESPDLNLPTQTPTAAPAPTAPDTVTSIPAPPPTATVDQLEPEPDTPRDESSGGKQQIFLSDRLSAQEETSRFPSLNNPEFIPASGADLDENELVLGISVGGESKAYPLRMMWFHHVANDIIGGEPVVITY